MQAGARPDSATYVRMKAKAAEEVGISFNHVSVPAESTVEEIVEIVQKLNANEAISGILVQLPLGQHIDAQGERTVTESISPDKDVDGCVTRSSLRCLLIDDLKVSMRTTSATSHPRLLIRCSHLALPRL